MTFGKFVTREIKAEDIRKAIENAGTHQRLSGKADPSHRQPGLHRGCRASPGPGAEEDAPGAGGR